VTVDALPGMTEMENEATKEAVRTTIEKRDEQSCIAKVNEERKAELLALGMVIVQGQNGEGLVVKAVDGAGGAFYYSTLLHTYEDWPKEVELVKSLIAARDEAAYHERLINERTERLIAAGWECDDERIWLTEEGRKTSSFFPHALVLPTWTEEGINELVSRGQAELVRRKTEQEERLRKEGEERERQRIAAEAEQKRIDDERRAAQMNDSEKWQQFSEAIKAAAPTMSSEIGKHAVKRVLTGLEAMTPGLLADLNK